jgi:iron complex outermembrane recepter protein
MDGLEIRSITSYCELDQSQLDNGIGAHTTPFRANANFSLYSLASLRQEQYSQEFQLLGTAGSVQYVAGVYYCHEEDDDDAWTPNTMVWNATGTVATRLPIPTAFPDRASSAKADSTALFGQFTWSPAMFDDKLHLTAGARYTVDKKSGTLTKVNGANTNFTFSIESDRIDPMVTLAYDPSENIHLYAKWGTAYRAGGANSRSVNYRAFEPETVETSEIGVKSEWFDRGASINPAAYSTKYKDIQIDFSAVNLHNSNCGTLETVNAPGEGSIDGFEADITLAPIDGLTLALGYAYTKGELPRAANPFNNNALQTGFIVYTPENALTASIDYQVAAFGDAMWKFHLDANQAEGYRGSSGDPTLSDESPILNGRIVLSDISLARGAKLQLSVWSRNLLNEEHTFCESRGGFAGFGAFGIFNEPQTFGVDATVSFYYSSMLPELKHMDRCLFVASLGTLPTLSLSSLAYGATRQMPHATRINTNSVRVTWPRQPSASASISISDDPAASILLATLVQTRLNGNEAVVAVPSSPLPYFVVRTGLGREVRVAKRILPLQGGRNFRDLGGYIGASNKPVKWGRIYRSGVMSSLTPADTTYLAR